MHWAIKAIQHAETYFNLLTAFPSDKIKLTKYDNQIYEAFRKEFPNMKIDIVQEINDFKTEAAKSKWRNFIEKYKPSYLIIRLMESIDLDDYNFGTLLRNNCTLEYSEENSFFVTRIQFLCVEIARNVEKFNECLKGRPPVPVDDTDMKAELDILQERIVKQLN
ncbi:polysaccharide biosynthesis domain containing protein 1 [Globomyces sp. JEL0801]|nr:polysaccharide biosynthesis domain containing protein 1 [Globomyces sp. JEL0801]